MVQHLSVVSFRLRCKACGKASALQKAKRHGEGRSCRELSKHRRRLIRYSKLHFGIPDHGTCKILRGASGSPSSKVHPLLLVSERAHRQLSHELWQVSRILSGETALGKNVEKKYSSMLALAVGHGAPREDESLLGKILESSNEAHFVAGRRRSRPRSALPNAELFLSSLGRCSTRCWLPKTSLRSRASPHPSISISPDPKLTYTSCPAYHLKLVTLRVPPAQHRQLSAQWQLSHSRSNRPVNCLLPSHGPTSPYTYPLNQALALS